MTGNDDDNLSVIETKYVDQGIEQRNVPFTFHRDKEHSVSNLTLLSVFYTSSPKYVGYCFKHSTTLFMRCYRAPQTMNYWLLLVFCNWNIATS